MTRYRRRMKQIGVPGIAAALVLIAVAAPADTIYQYMDERGRKVYTDKLQNPDSGLTYQNIWTWKGWQLKPTNAVRDYHHNRKRFRPLVVATARKYGLPPELVDAVVRAESAYDPVAVSSAGAVGLMQLMPATAKRYGVTNRRNPEQNVTGGSRYLRDLLHLFDNDIHLSLAAYNAGENAVKRYGHTIPPYRETQQYVRRVLGYYNAHQGDF